MKIRDPITRFSDRAEDYKKYRPDYPPELISFIVRHCPVDRSWSIADVGSGTGISTRLLLTGLKCRIYAVEPNSEMRKEAEAHIRNNPLFISVNGSAENTTLRDASVNMVATFQAFHWFDKRKTREEFLRILKEPKWVLIVWNSRVTDETEFLKDYETLLQSLPEYGAVNHRNITVDDIYDFIGNDQILTAQYPNNQKLDIAGLRGRFFSSSYSPAVGSETYDFYDRELERLYNKHNRNGILEIKYHTEVYLGKML